MPVEKNDKTCFRVFSKSKLKDFSNASSKVAILIGK